MNFRIVLFVSLLLTHLCGYGIGWEHDIWGSKFKYTTGTCIISGGGTKWTIETDDNTSEHYSLNGDNPLHIYVSWYGDENGMFSFKDSLSFEVYDYVNKTWDLFVDTDAASGLVGANNFYLAPKYVNESGGSYETQFQWKASKYTQNATVSVTASLSVKPVSPDLAITELKLLDSSRSATTTLETYECYQYQGTVKNIGDGGFSGRLKVKCTPGGIFQDFYDEHDILFGVQLKPGETKTFTASDEFRFNLSGATYQGYGVAEISKMSLDGGDFVDYSDSNSGNDSKTSGVATYEEETESDTSPPTPNPPVWEKEPYFLGSDTVEMEFGAVSDPAGGIKYRIYYKASTATDWNYEDWNVGRYVDAEITNSGKYDFCFKACDANGNETGYSSIKSIEITNYTEDTDSPSPVRWSENPYSIGLNEISMSADTTYDDVSGDNVEYCFEETTGHSGGSDSGWVSDPTYDDDGLSEDTEYSYRFKVRDSTGNESAWSSTLDCYTDTTPPNYTIIKGNVYFSNENGSSRTVEGAEVRAVDRKSGQTYVARTLDYNDDDYSYEYQLKVPCGSKYSIRLKSLPDGFTGGDTQFYDRNAYISSIKGPCFYCVPDSYNNFWGMVSDESGDGISSVDIILVPEPASYIFNKVTNQAGYYSIYVPQSWSGSIKVSPATGKYSDPPGYYVDSNVEARKKDFTLLDSPPANPSVVISGRVVLSGNGGGVCDVTVAFSNGGPAVNTDDDGFYAAQVPVDWSGDVTLQGSVTSEVFIPLSRTYSNVNSSFSDQNYEYTPGLLTISGVVNAGGAGIEVKYGNPFEEVWSYAYTSEDGSYSFHVEYGSRVSMHITGAGGRADPSYDSLGMIYSDQTVNFDWISSFTGVPFFQSLVASGNSRVEMNCNLNNMQAANGKIQWRSVFQVWSSNREQSFSAESSGEQFLDGLSSDVNYYFRLQAYNAEFYLYSAWSNESSVRTWENAPVAPAGVSATAQDFDKIIVNWSYEDIPALQLFTVMYRRPGASWKNINCSKYLRSYLLTGLSPGSSYDIKLVASTLHYQSTDSSIASVVTERLPKLALSTAVLSANVVQGPGHRPSFSVTVSNSGEGLLNWSASAIQGNTALSKTAGVLTAGSSESVSLVCNTDMLKEGDSPYFVRFEALVNGITQTKDVKILISVSNAKAKARNVYVVPSYPVTGTALQGFYTYLDPDGHPQGNSTKRWYRNNILYSSGSSFLPGYCIIKGDRWMFEVIAHDCYKQGTTTRSQALVIQNAPPVISGKSIEVNQEGTYSLDINLVSSDPDDPDTALTYSLVSLKPQLGALIQANMLTINPFSGWYGSSVLVIEVSDGNKKSVASFPVRVDARPWITGNPPSSIITREDEKYRCDLWPYFEDFELSDSDLIFNADNSETNACLRIIDGRFLEIWPDPDWPLTFQGEIDSSITVTSTDNRNQSIQWSPVVTYVPVNDAPKWTGSVQDISIQDCDSNPLAGISSGGTGLRSILYDVDTDLNAVPDSSLLSLSSADPDLTVTLESDSIRINPSGGWWGSAIVTVIANDRDMRAEPYDLSASTTFKVTVTDDDSTPPVFSNFNAESTGQPVTWKDTLCWIPEHTEFYISCTIMDSQSGIYDDATGGAEDEQSVYLIWDNDGDLSNGYADLMQMQLDAGSTYKTISPVPAQDGEVADNFVFEVVAWDNDFDRGYAGDRTRGSSALRRELVINDLPIIYPLEITDEQQFDVSVELSLQDANREAQMLKIEYLDPRDEHLYPADMLGAISNILDYALRTNVWRSAYQDAAGNWTGDLPNLDIGDPRSVYANLCVLRMQAFDGKHWGAVTNISFHLDNNLPPELALNFIQSELDAQGWTLPLFDFTLRDIENDTLAVRMEHRWPGGDEWLPSKVRMEGDWSGNGWVSNRVSESQIKTIEWDAVTDTTRDGQVPFNPQDINDVRIRLTGYDLDSGNTATSTEFTLDLFPEPIINTNNTDIQDSGSLIRWWTQSYTITPGYVRHLNGDSAWYSNVFSRALGSGVVNPVGPVLDMHYAYQLPGDTNLYSITLPEMGGTNLPQKLYSQYFSIGLEFEWFFGSGVSTLPRSSVSGVTLLVAADNDEKGEWFTTDPHDLDNNYSPEISEITIDSAPINPEGTMRGDIGISLTADDFENDSVSLRFQFSTNGTYWTDATILDARSYVNIATGDLALVWLSIADLPLMLVSNVHFRVAADDDSAGDWMELAGTITIDNRNLSPKVEITGVTAMGSAVGVDFNLSDENGDAMQLLTFAWSEDGVTWNNVDISDICGGTLAYRPGSGSLIWDASADPLLAGRNIAALQLRLSVDDGTPFIFEEAPVGHAAVDALSYDGTQLWTFDFAQDKGWRHDISQSGLPVIEAAGFALGFPFPFPQQSDASGIDGAPWLLAPEVTANRSNFVGMRWTGTAFSSYSEFYMYRYLVYYGVDLASDSVAYAVTENALYEIGTTTASHSSLLLCGSVCSNETSLAWFDGFDPLYAGVWTLNEVSNCLYQYATTDSGWEPVRMQPAVKGLTGIEFVNGILWSADALSNRLVRTDSFSASLYDHSNPIVLDLTSVVPVTPPVSISVSTTTPVVGDAVVLTVNAVMGGAVTNIRWTCSGVLQPDYNDLTQLPANALHAGHVWQAEVWSSNVDGVSTSLFSDLITVLNSAPQIGTLQKQPAQGYVDQSLSVSGTPIDPDGYALDLEYSWYLNDTLHAEYTSATLPWFATSIGDIWECRLIATDVAGESSIFTFNWAVQNYAPVFELPDTMTAVEADWLWFRLEADDPDHNDLQFDFITGTNALPGVSMWHKEAHTFFWWPTYSAAGNYDLTFSVTDLGPYGATVTQTVAVTVADTARAPFLYAPNDIVVWEGESIDLLDGQLGGDFDLINGTVSLETLKDLGVEFYVRGSSNILYPPATLDYTDFQDLESLQNLNSLDSKELEDNLCKSVNTACQGVVPLAGQSLVDSILSTNLWIQTDYDDSGSYEIELYAVDPSGITSTPRIVRVFINNVNRPPILTAPSFISVTEGDTVQFNVTAFDPDNANSVTNDDTELDLYWNGPWEMIVTNDSPNNWSVTWPTSYEDAGYRACSFMLTDNGEPEYTTNIMVIITVGNLSSADTDGDGLPDDWERDNFGSLDNDGSGDYDNDGFSNHEELIGSSDPADAESIPAQITRSILLTNGWNRVALDVTSDDMTLSNLFNAVQGNITQIYGWNADDQEWWRWNLEKPFLSTVSATNEVQSRQAMNIQVTNTCLWTVSGATSNSVVNLKPGWNYVTPPGFTEKTIPADLIDLSGSCELISDMRDDYEFATGTGSLTNTVPQKVYWLYMNKYHTWE